MRKKNKRTMFTILMILVIMIFVLSIAFALLSKSLNINLGTVTQKAVGISIRFEEGSVSGVASGNNVTDIRCGSATATDTTITGIKIDLTDIGDKCSYTFHVLNDGEIDAKITSITPTEPNGVTCSTASGSSMVCGNITYKLRYDTPTNTIQPTIGDVITAQSGSLPTSKTMVLTAEYTGSTNESEDFFQKGFAFTINYGQV